MDDFSFGDAILWTFWFMLAFAAIWLFVVILTDIFRDPTLSGWGKAGWTLFLILIPWLAAFVYLISRGRSMEERNAQRRESQQRDYRPGVAGPASTADELGKLADLRTRGVLTELEYERAKAVLLQTPVAHAND